ncbi:acetyl-CoA synthetase-like protein [Aspergillus ellipticus CBS 707.79]|uniref:Acetyl-CoA synthetase-like protein n=1 Tax=Aspergillus ellipticus CBS 707.79 TaxID=1448320 RepID=A0A319CU97_9EURO|nr:acetyl-CoA synthetase-like protein [Aspergillus ellipticus CBS 707.79]
MNVFGTTVDPTITLHGGECGKRLIPHIIDATARATPDVECFSVPRTDNQPRDGWKPVSWAQVPHAVDYVAHMLVQQGGHPPAGSFPTVAYIGREDPRYPIFVVGAIKAGYQALLISPRNSPWVDGRPGMASVAVAPWETWAVAEMESFPYTKTFEEAEWDPYVVLHTSGSTGLPKPIVIRQGMLALNDLHRTIPARDGNRTWLPTWTSYSNSRHLLIFPLFHTAGIMTSTMCGFYYNAPIAFRDPSLPITAENGWTLMPPAILEQMSRSSRAVEELKQLHAVGFGGGAIAPTPANDLLNHGIHLANAIAATEYIYFPYYSQPDPSLWPYNTPGNRVASMHFPELQEFSTKVLYRPHPTLADHWTYLSRADDIIVFSTGEKLNPTTIEGAVMGHPGVLGAQVVGTNYFHAALLIEPEFLDAIWPIIDKVNVETVAHGRISREYVFLSDPQRPFPRAGKGTIQRAMAFKVYEPDIKRIFEASRDEGVVAVDLDLTSQSAFVGGVRAAMQSVLGMPNLDKDDDMFAAGVESLQAIRIARVLRVSLAKSGVQLDEADLEPRTIYAYPTIAQLAAFAYSLATSSTYTHSLPPPYPNKPAPADNDQVLIITGTTGAIGSYLLDFALASPRVNHVICLNRSPNGEARQTEASARPNLPNLGLAPDFHSKLAGSADRIIHNAWPVNFNHSISSFEPHLRGVRHLIELSARAQKSVPIIFLSSVATVEHWNGFIPEIALEQEDNWSHTSTRYSRSKLASSMILDAAATSSGIPRAIIRVGQVAGPRGPHGRWNPQEWLPSLIRSSFYLGLLPDSLGVLGHLSWSPIEDIANIVLEVSGVTAQTSVKELDGYFHALNPKQTEWANLVPTLRELYGERIQKVVSLEEWVDALDKSQAGRDGHVDRNPAVNLKLLDTYRVAARSTRTGASMEKVSPDLMRHWCEQWGF